MKINICMHIFFSSFEDDDGTKISRDLASYVIKTGQKINLENAYLDPRFDPLVDSVWQSKSKSILCVPICNQTGTILGCAQVTNRLDDQPFDENDEQLFEAFCIFCGLGINNTIIYNQLETSMAEKSVALEVLSYHATCTKNELNTFVQKYEIYSLENLNVLLVNKNLSKEKFSSYVFDDFAFNSDEMILASFEIFKQSGLVKTFQIDKNVSKCFYIYEFSVLFFS